MSARRCTWRGTETGSATLELAVFAPALLALLGLVIVAGRVVVAAGAVEQAAAAAARAASLSRDAGQAQARADRAIHEALRGQALRCAEVTSRVDTSGFGLAIGRPASVSVEVTCAVPLRDLAVPGMPGTRTVAARAASPLDSSRGRG